MISKKIVLNFPKTLLDKPIICTLVKSHHLDFNILKALVTPKEEGLLVLELAGEKKDYNHGLEYLKNLGIQVQPLSQDIIRDEERCIHCGVCVPMCPTDALMVESKTRRILFSNNECIACELCIEACPQRAMEVRL